MHSVFQDDSEHKLTEMIQYSYNHFPTLRGMVWPKGIEKLSDFYYNVSPEELYKVFSQKANHYDILNHFFHRRKEIIWLRQLTQ
jgi:hypothetical protein